MEQIQGISDFIEIDLDSNSETSSQGINIDFEDVEEPPTIFLSLDSVPSGVAESFRQITVLRQELDRLREKSRPVTRWLTMLRADKKQLLDERAIDQLAVSIGNNRIVYVLRRQQSRGIGPMGRRYYRKGLRELVETMYHGSRSQRIFQMASDRVESAAVPREMARLLIEQSLVPRPTETITLRQTRRKTGAQDSPELWATLHSVWYLSKGLRQLQKANAAQETPLRNELRKSLAQLNAFTELLQSSPSPDSMPCLVELPTIGLTDGAISMRLQQRSTNGINFWRAVELVTVAFEPFSEATLQKLPLPDGGSFEDALEAAESEFVYSQWVKVPTVTLQVDS